MPARAINPASPIYFNRDLSEIRHDPPEVSVGRTSSERNSWDYPRGSALSLAMATMLEAAGQTNGTGGSGSHGFFRESMRIDTSVPADTAADAPAGQQRRACPPIWRAGRNIHESGRSACVGLPGSRFRYSGAPLMLAASVLGPALGPGDAQVMVPLKLAAWVTGWFSVIDSLS
jgi:hypothetical protein